MLRSGNLGNLSVKTRHSWRPRQDTLGVLVHRMNGGVLVCFTDMAIDFRVGPDRHKPRDPVSAHNTLGYDIIMIQRCVVKIDTRPLPTYRLFLSTVQ